MEENMVVSDNLPMTGVSNMAGGGQRQASMSLTTGILGMLTNQQAGGLEGFVRSFARKGLGDVVSSWISMGPNLPVSGEQIQSVLGSDTVNLIGQIEGVAPDVARSILAQVLPGIVDKLTPEGKIPENGTLLEQIIKILKGIRSRTGTHQSVSPANGL
jgi:uncharacterized protein YidB (DUF937 family)